MKNRLLCLTLALIMIFSLLPMSAFAASATSGKCGDNATWSLSDDGVLTISGTGDMYDYEYKHTPWYDFHNAIKTLIIKNGITSISDYAFYECSSLTSVEIPNSVTSIGDWAFYCCESLTSIDIPDSVRSIGDYVFCNCYDLTSIDISYSVTSIGVCAFESCRSLTSITIPDSVTGIGEEAFYGCSSLTSVTIPNSVTSIGNYAFYCCESLTSVTIGNSVTSIGVCAFEGCKSLTSIDIPDSVISIGMDAFANCGMLTDVYYGGTRQQWNALKEACYKDNEWLFDANIHIHETGTCGKNATWSYSDSVLTISGTGDMYDYCYDDYIDELAPWYSLKDNFKTVIIQKGITSIADFAFYGCSRLTSIEIPDSVTSIGEKAFCECNNLQAISVDSKNSSYSSVDGVLFNKDKTTLIQYPRGKSDESYAIPNSVTSIGERAFCDCTSLTSIEIPDSVTSIGDWAFCECDVLTNVTIGSSVTSIGDRVFYRCTSLTSIEISNSVTSIGDYAFNCCGSLTSINIPNSVTSIGDGAFYYCDSLTDVYYGGTSLQWNALKEACGHGNASLLNANVHFILSILKQAKSLTAISGTIGKFSIVADGDGLTYQWQYLKPDSTTWTNSTMTSAKTDTLSVNVREAIDGYKYRCVVKDVNNKTITSKAVTLTVLPKATITKQPVSVKTLNGTSCTFNITAIGGGLKYQWQYQKPSTTTWVDSTATSGKTDTLSVNARDAINGYMYRCIVKDSAGNTATSNVATLTVKPYLQISQQPSDLTADSGTVGKFSVKASGTNMTYQWQYQKPDSTAWTNSTASSAKTATFSVNVREAINGYKYRCVVSDGNGNKVTSSVAKLTVMPVITTQPNALKAASGTSGTFSVTATGDGVTYQWQYLKPNGTWTNSTASSAKTATFSVNVREAINGYKYRCKVTNSCGNKVISDVATLTVIPKITVQPKNLTADSGKTAKISISATGEGLTYQWQYLKPGGSWTNSTSTRAKTANLSVNAREAINGYKYRCKVTNSCGNSVTSKTVTLTVISADEIELIELPTDVTAANGTTAKFTIKASGNGISYQWQYQKPGTTTWINSTSTSGTTATFSVNARTAIDGYKYRCIVKDSAGNSITSNVVTLTVK